MRGAVTYTHQAGADGSTAPLPSRKKILVIFGNPLVILPVVLYGYETWSLTFRDKRKLRVFENMVLRRIFGPRRDEVTGNGGDCITRS